MLQSSHWKHPENEKQWQDSNHLICKQLLHSSWPSCVSPPPDFAPMRSFSKQGPCMSRNLSHFLLHGPEAHPDWLSLSRHKLYTDRLLQNKSSSRIPFVTSSQPPATVTLMELRAAPRQEVRRITSLNHKQYSSHDLHIRYVRWPPLPIHYMWLRVNCSLVWKQWERWRQMTVSF